MYVYPGNLLFRIYVRISLIGINRFSVARGLTQSEFNTILIKAHSLRVRMCSVNSH